MEDGYRMVLEESKRLLEGFEGEVAAGLFSATGASRARQRGLLRDVGAAITGLEGMLQAGSSADVDSVVC